MENDMESILRGREFKRILENSMQEIRKQTGFKRVELEILHSLHIDQENNTMKDICAAVQMNKGHISMAMDGLCKKGYLTQVQDAEDRRYVRYFLTENANEVVEAITKEWNRMMQCLIKGISQEDLQNMKRISQMVQKNIEEMLTEETHVSNRNL